MSTLVNSSREGKPLVLTAGCFFALFVILTAINAPPAIEHVNSIPFWRPFEVISNNNRSISITMALGLSILCFVARPGLLSMQGSMVAVLLLILHLLILLKNFFSIGISALIFFAGFVLLLIATRAIAKFMVTAGTNSWWPLVLASVGFLAANLVQYRINHAATMQVSSRFHGLTSNPQMYALTVAIMVPALLFQFANDHRKSVRLVIMFAFLLLLFFALYSGSRLSILLGAVSLLMFYRAKVVKLAAFGVPLLILATLWAICGEPLQVDSHSHLVTLEDTRSNVWRLQMEFLMENPVMGRPLAPGERVGFGENSYLAAGATLGLPGLLVVLLLALVVGQKVLALLRLEGRVGWHPEFAFPIAVLTACLLGAFFEAFLLGICTFPLTALLYTVFIAEEMCKGSPAGAAMSPEQPIQAVQPPSGVRRRIQWPIRQNPSVKMGYRIGPKVSTAPTKTDLR